MDYSSRVEKVCRSYRKAEKKYIAEESGVSDQDDYKKLKWENRKKLYGHLLEKCLEFNVSIMKLATILDISNREWDAFVDANGLVEKKTVQ